MPVTLTTAAHPPRKWDHPSVSRTEELFAHSCPEEQRQSKKVIQSSFPRRFFRENHISASQHGFVWAVFHAYSHHHHLTLRPEDIWFSILTQLSFFINAHAEELRSLFVAHEGKKKLHIKTTGTIHTVDFGALALQMTRLIEENIIDEELRTWIMPNFSTTTTSDTVVTAILMMGTLQKYFSYQISIDCGIPSVTLLGKKKDWEKLAKRLDKLYQLGDEPARFAQLLRPVLNYFIVSFDNPSSPDVLDFWSRCAHKESMGSGSDYLGGWVSVFCFWDVDGRLLYSEPIYPISSPEFQARSCAKNLEDGLSRCIDTEDVPSGFASVPVTVDDNGTIYETMMLAGLVGIQATSSGAMRDGTRYHNSPPLYEDSPYDLLEPAVYSVLSATEQAGLDTIQPLSGWWMYEQRPGGQAEEEQERGSGTFMSWIQQRLS
ncbi:hypothetical protein VI817_008909 [Penicillium citrinum]|uniref:Uncharacterized protein n=1 Tax=Penicillium hetheringtonii TaxID=911720 RepID=A0AAD6GR41_9EURO|nr:hypothetical protein N7450_005542 [Penicillium hetheringtonii]KAK5789786.1 hypothetical protein VI817_008909 [Penicillium citrinum]